MLETATITLTNVDGTTERCELAFKVSHTEVSMQTQSPSLGRDIYIGRDAFHALELFRRKIEPVGWRALCNGSRTDAYPSGMCRDMGRGFVLYPIPPMGPPDLRTFEPAPIEMIGTVQEQLDNWNAWVASTKTDKSKLKYSLWDKLRGKK